jgi:hypothetical protein
MGSGSTEAVEIRESQYHYIEKLPKMGRRISKLWVHPGNAYGVGKKAKMPLWFGVVQTTSNPEASMSNWMLYHFW